MPEVWWLIMMSFLKRGNTLLAGKCKVQLSLHRPLNVFGKRRRFDCPRVVVVFVHIIGLHRLGDEPALEGAVVALEGTFMRCVVKVLQNSSVEIKLELLPSPSSTTLTVVPLVHSSAAQARKAPLLSL